MRQRLTLSLLLAAAALPAAAHPGHLGPRDGHDHWLALGLVGLAALIGAGGLLRRLLRRLRARAAARRTA